MSASEFVGDHPTSVLLCVSCFGFGFGSGYVLIFPYFLGHYAYLPYGSFCINRSLDIGGGRVSHVRHGRYPFGFLLRKQLKESEPS